MITTESGWSALIFEASAVNVVAFGSYGDLAGNRRAGAGERSPQAVQEALAVVGGLTDELNVGVALADDQVAQRLRLQAVRRRRAEVVAVVGIGGQHRAGVGRRALDHVGAGDLVDHRQRVAGRGGADDRVHVVGEQRVGALRDQARLVGALVAPPTCDDRLAVHSAGGVDVLERKRDAVAHRRLEEGQRAGVRQQHTRA